tara:strand:+ start:471 stop:1472 length:1002 start_codon:yes stop_codon:yes gene_type:complete
MTADNPSPEPIIPEREQIVVRQSSIKEYQNCKRLYGWSRLQGLQQSQRRPALAIGTAVHSGLADFFSGATVFDATTHAVEKFKEEMGPPQLPGEQTILQEGEDLIKRMLPAYHDHWAKVEGAFTPLGIEVEFFVEVGEDTGVFIRGRVDNLNSFLGGLWLVDHKTIGRNDPRDRLKYEMDAQPTTYIYGLTKQLSIENMARGGKPVIIRGLIVDWLIKTKTPQFERARFSRTVPELREWESETVEIGKEILHRFKRVREGEDWKTVFYKNPDHCFRFGQCAFRDLCVKDTPARRSAYIRRESDYVDDAQKALNAGATADIANEPVKVGPVKVT